MTSWWQHFSKNVSQPDCDYITTAAMQYDEVVGKVGHGGKAVQNEMRRSSIRWVPRYDPNLKWFFQHVVVNALKVNHDHFQLDLADYPTLRFTNAQFAEYYATEEGHYDWHEDNCWVSKDRRTHDRKLSMVLQLSPPTDYEGGRLELERSPLPDGKFTEQGDMIFFPSHLRHRVTPVTKGTRRSLVMWFEGPLLR